MRIALALAVLATVPLEVTATDRAVRPEAQAAASFASPRHRSLASASGVTLRWIDVERRWGSAEFDAMAGEALSVFRALEVPLHWARGEAGVGFDKGDGSEVLVIAVEAQPQLLGPERILGLVTRDHEPPSPIWVFVDNVRWALGHSGRGSSPSEQRELAVAVGRVVAHELVHALAPRRPHAATGLMAPTLNRVSLLAEGAPLDPGWVRSIRSGFAVLARNHLGDPDLGRALSGPR